MRRNLWLSVVFIFAVVSDQFSKFVVDSTFNLYDSRSMLGDYLRLTYIRNSGAAFGISFGSSKVMFAVTVLVVILLVYLYLKGTLRPEHIIGKIAVIMVLGGAIGNLIDRIRMGEVIDFIDMGIGNHRWPIYNFADIYVTIGMFILFFIYTVQKDDSEESLTQTPG